VSDTTPVPRGLRVAAAYGWRILILSAVAYLVISLLARLELVFIALFVGLIFTAIVGPMVRFLNNYIPHFLAVTLGMLTLLGVIVGIIGFITNSVAGEWGTLAQEFSQGIGQIERWLEGPPFNVHGEDFTVWYDTARVWVLDHRGDFVKGALGSAGTVLEGFAGFALAIFSAVCFIGGGDGIWKWTIGLFPRQTKPRVDGAGHVAWVSFAGYVRGIIIVAASNAVFVCVLLLILGVPLAVPLSLLVFFGTFIPLIGAPIAMIVAVVVALAGKGPVTALIVLAGIVLLGQLEGHVLQPLVMSRAVNIHPLAVAVAVASGSILAGLAGAVIAVPVVSVIYGVSKFWIQTSPRDTPLGSDPTGTGAAQSATDLPPLTA